MKELGYIMRIMATSGGLTADDTCKMAHRGLGCEWITFQYTKPFDWHVCYRHAVDDHNNLRHALPSLEDTWVTQRWEIQVFAFLLAVTEVNTYLAMRHFVWPKEVFIDQPTLVDFRGNFA